MPPPSTEKGEAKSSEASRAQESTVTKPKPERKRGGDFETAKREVDALGVITISRGCFERCCSNKKTPPYHSNLSFVALLNRRPTLLRAPAYVRRPRLALGDGAATRVGFFGHPKAGRGSDGWRRPLARDGLENTHSRRNTQGPTSVGRAPLTRAACPPHLDKLDFVHLGGRVGYLPRFTPYPPHPLDPPPPSPCNTALGSIDR